MQQRSKEWFKARRGKATGSKFDDVMKKGRSKDSIFGEVAKAYMLEIVSEILTGESKTISSPALEWGTEHEEFAIKAYQKQLEVIVAEKGFVPAPHKQLVNRAGTSPDGLVGKDGIIEVKCPWNTNNHIRTLIHREVPKKYVAQIQGNLYTTGRKWCDFISYDPRIIDPKLRICIIRVDRDQEYIDELEKRLLQFTDEVDYLLSEVNKGQ